MFDSTTHTHTSSSIEMWNACLWVAKRTNRFFGVMTSFTHYHPTTHPPPLPAASRIVSQSVTRHPRCARRQKSMNSRGVRSSLGFGGDFPAVVEAHLARWRHQSAAAPARAPLHSKPRRWDGTRRATPALYGLYRPASVAFPARTHCR